MITEQGTNQNNDTKNKKPENRKAKSRVIAWFMSIIGVLLGVITGLVFLVWYSPTAYKPQQPQNPEQVSLYLTHELAPEFVNQVQLEKPFELVIEQAGLNDIISRQLWPQHFGELSFADPVVYFTEQNILIMGTLKYKEISSVISITALPQMNEQGQICMNIQSIRLGMLPVTSFVATLVKDAVNENQGIFEGDPELQSIVEAVINNEYFDPAFMFFDYRVRTTAFTLNPGVIQLTLESSKK